MIAAHVLAEKVKYICPGAPIQANILRRRGAGTISYSIELAAEQQIWPTPFVRGGWSSRLYVASARSMAGAEKTAAKILRTVERLRAKQCKT